MTKSKNMAQQTALDWYYEQTVIQGRTNYAELLEKAKQMEKEQIFHAFGVGCHVESKRLIGYHGMAEQYYNETFGKS